jgi:hypothetical protein
LPENLSNGKYTIVYKVAPLKTVKYYTVVINVGRNPFLGAIQDFLDTSLFDINQNVCTDFKFAATAGSTCSAGNNKNIAFKFQIKHVVYIILGVGVVALAIRWYSKKRAIKKYKQQRQRRY